MKINTKLSLAFLIIALLFIITGTIFIVNSHNSLADAAFNQLISTRTDKKIQIEEFFAERKHDMHFLLDTVDLFRLNGFEKLNFIRESRKLQIEKYFQEQLHHISFFSRTLSMSKAIFEHDETHKVDTDSHDITEQEITNECKIEIDKLKNTYRYHNVLLVATDGDIVYDTSKNNFTGNILQNELKDSVSSDIFQQGIKKITVHDFSILNNVPVFSISTPVYTSENKIGGILIIYITFDVINEIVQKKVGITGEAYLVGDTNGNTSYRSKRLVQNKENSIGIQKTGNDIKEAFAGNSNVRIKIGSTELYYTQYS